MASFPMFLPLSPQGSVSSVEGRSWCPEAWSGGKAGQLVPSCECCSHLFRGRRKRGGRGTPPQISELHHFPSWGCRVVGGGSVPQPQQPESLRDQIPRVAPEKQLRTRASGRGNNRAQGQRLAWQSHAPPGPGPQGLLDCWHLPRSQVGKQQRLVRS